MTREAIPAPDSRPGPAADGQREVRFEHSSDLGRLLRRAGCSLLVSTYQAGKLAVIGSNQDDVTLSFHNFDRPMGVAASADGDRLAVAARDRVYLLWNARDVAGRLNTTDSYDACYLTRTAQFTGEIQAHELGWQGGELWIVNTLFSCLCTLDTRCSFVPRWRPPFVSALAAEDRCHLNGLAMAGGRPAFVTVMAETDSAAAWREDKDRTGCVLEVASGRTVARGFAMPHSPRVYQRHLLLLDSGRGTLVRVEPSSGRVDVIARFPGYTRGLALHGSLAFVGLSRIRETSTFGGVPIAEHRDRLKCGVAVVDLRNGQLVGQFEFKSGVEEIFDVTVMQDVRRPSILGPFAKEDGQTNIWVVPDELPLPEGDAT